jgi:hypothetical protein
MSVTAGNPDHSRPPLKVFAVSVLAALVGLIVALSFGYADHAPKPHGVKIAVAAPHSVIAQMSTAIDAAEPGGFLLVPASSAQAVVASVRAQRATGGFVLPGSGPATVVTASATGATAASAINKMLTGVAAHMHRGVRSVDAVPLPASDSAGLSSFVFELCLLIPSLIGSVGFFLFGSRHRVWWRVAGAALFALLVGGSAVLALDAVFGALTGATLALLGVAVFGALTFVLTFGALQALVGLPGTALAALVLVFTGNAVSGGTVPVSFLPGGFRQIAPWLPNNAIVHASQSVVYFSGNNMGHAMLVLGIWSGTALAIFCGVDVLHRLARRWMPQHVTAGHVVTAQALLIRLNHGLGRAVAEANDPPPDESIDGLDLEHEQTSSEITASTETMELVR